MRCRSNKKCRPATLPDSACGAETFPHSTAGFWRRPAGFPLQVCKKRLTCNTRRSGRPICVAGRTKNADLKHFRTRPAAQRPSLTQHRDLASLRSPHPCPPAADGDFWRRAPLPRRGVWGEGNVRGDLSLTQHRDLASLRSPHPCPPAAGFAKAIKKLRSSKLDAVFC